MLTLLSTNWYTIFYWLSVVDNVRNVAGAISVASATVIGFVLLIGGIWTMVEGEELPSWGRKAIKWCVPLGIFFALVYGFVPSKGQMIFIIAGGQAASFLTSDSSSRAIPADVTKYIHDYLQKEIKTLDDDTKAELGLESPKEKLIRKAKDLTKEQILEMLQTDSTSMK